MLFSVDTTVRGRFSEKRCGPSRRCARNASAALENFVCCPQKTFSTASVKRRNTRCEQMFSAVLPISDIRRERALGHAEGVAHHPDDAPHACGSSPPAPATNFSTIAVAGLDQGEELEAPVQSRGSRKRSRKSLSGRQLFERELGNFRRVFNPQPANRNDLLGDKLR